jgi:hypothetical protein
MKGITMPNDQKSNNPLADLISDEIFDRLTNDGLINQKSLRDHLIRKRFVDLKRNNHSVIEAIDSIRKDYPYLQYDTIRKIVYNIQK